MKRFIRWQGLLGLTIFIGLLAAFFYLFADNIVKHSLISVSEKSLGAEVNIEDVELHYFPTGISIIQVQATDPKQPENNLFSWNKLTAKLDLWQYFQGNIIIDDVEVTEVRFSEVRTRPGKVYAKDDKTDVDGTNALGDSANGFGLGDTQLPDVKTLLEDSNLLTVKNGEVLAASYKTEKEKILAFKSQLPDKAKLDKYKAQVKALSKRKIKSLADVNAVKDEFNVLKKQFKAERKLIKAAKKQIADSKTLLSEQVKTLKDSPNQDWKNIESKYQLDKIDAADFAHILFGEHARKYTEYTTKVWKHIAPLLQKSSDNKPAVTESNQSDSGRFVHFETNNAIPSFWLKRASASLYIANKQYALNMNNLTHQHWLINESSDIKLQLSDNGASGKEEALSEKVMARYLFDVDAQKDFHAQGAWTIAQMPLSHMDLKKGSKFSLALTQGKLNLNGKLEQDNSIINSSNDVALSKLIFEGSAQGHITQAILATIQSSPELDLSVKVTGEVTEPNIAIDSPLNDMLADSLQKQIHAKLASFKGEVESGLQDKLSQALSDNDKENKELQGYDKSLDALDSSLDDLMDTKMTDQYKDKLKSKLGKLFG